jgi:TRAP-type C4-dicarboxylate transport system permease small subunit
MKKFVDTLEIIQSAFSFILFIALVIVVLIQVTSRFISHNPVIWSEETARFLLFWVTLMGASLSVKNKRHFTIEFFTPEKIKNESIKRIFQIIPDLCITLFALFMIIAGIKYCQMGYLRVGPSSNINMLYIYMAIPVAGATMVTYSLFHIIQLVSSWKSHIETNSKI